MTESRKRLTVEQYSMLLNVIAAKPEARVKELSALIGLPFVMNTSTVRLCRRKYPHLIGRATPERVLEHQRNNRTGVPSGPKPKAETEKKPEKKHARLKRIEAKLDLLLSELGVNHDG